MIITERERIDNILKFNNDAFASSLSQRRQTTIHKV